VILFLVYGYFWFSIKNEGDLRNTGFVDRDGMDKALNLRVLGNPQGACHPLWSQMLAHINFWDYDVST
jgi:hypothetical protein